MNETINTLMEHTSIRSFEDRPLSAEQIHTLIESAQAASTSSFIQAYSIIGITDQTKKEKLAELAGNQTYVAKNGHFFIFCADLYRHQVIAESKEIDLSESLESTEKFMVSVIDASLAAQNAVVAAESMGLGICYIGGIRNNLEEVGELLRVPKHVIPLFGLAVGYPSQSPEKKPRLPRNHIYHQEEYQQDLVTYKKQLSEYDAIISNYYAERTNGKRQDNWTDQMVNMLSNPKRMYMNDYVKRQGFTKR
ncbi:oxygen-insensitive NADPH nitroreductase [Desertibacillus haloalkaliphilus]|uniref:oxygen-insensitive NADPH nitroreductase n=1 Tax=Desertibacillus haloalkaliphilus TaxID=1328930 RepID=UPI001C2777DB|nr:oxygen-insensitive NADPH nitroreductase [Desertibacillus haloalkaliphilus]MBU8906102.1 oxygen-insensitive NADPH nitroreductase [Desertibacillus haloalkaliphilus]